MNTFFKKVTGSLIGSTLALSLVVSPVFAAGSTDAYNAIPATLPPNVASVGYQATSTSEFGDSIKLAGNSRILSSATVTMSDWALYSDYSSDARYSGNTASWTHPITLNIYSSHLGNNNAPDTLLATKTQSVSIPWRQAADPTCTGGTAWRASDGKCYNGKAFNASFDMSNLNVTLPDDVIVGIAYNTQNYGSSPIGVAGPYNSLNVGTPAGQTATVGVDNNIDGVFLNTSYAPFYTDGGTNGVGIFREDTAWSPYGTVAIKIATNALMPTDKDQCKKDGWKSFGNTFKNQGDCVSSVSARDKK